MMPEEAAIWLRVAADPALTLEQARGVIVGLVEAWKAEEPILRAALAEEYKRQQEALKEQFEELKREHVRQVAESLRRLREETNRCVADGKQALKEHRHDPADWWKADSAEGD